MKGNILTKNLENTGCQSINSKINFFQLNKFITLLLSNDKFFCRVNNISAYLEQFKTMPFLVVQNVEDTAKMFNDCKKKKIDAVNCL